MLKLSATNLLRHKVRTFLCILGILIGVTAIISIVSVIDGISFDISNAFRQMQGISVFEKGGIGPLFSEIPRAYEHELETIPGVKDVIPTQIVLAKNVEGKTLQSGLFPVEIVGSDYSKKSYKTAAGVGGEILEGRSLKSGDSGKVVVGEELMNSLNKFLGNKIDIEGKKFEIIGVYRTGSQRLNSAILMSLQDLQDLRGLPKDKVGQYVIELFNPEDAEKIAKLIEFKFPNKLKAISTSNFSAQIAKFLNILRLLVLAVATLSAIVAGVGILNTMLMSVTERFKEIGTLKATGWDNFNIMKMIVFESLIIGLIGGILGVVSGLGVSFVLQNQLNITSLVSMPLLIEAMTFAIVIGIIAGVYPAYVASQVDPVDVLQYE